MKISGEEVIRALNTQRMNADKQIRDIKNTPVEKSRSSVEFSDAARQVQRVKRELDNVSDVREDVIADLRARIQAGTYTVSAEDIADLMIRRANADQLR